MDSGGVQAGRIVFVLSWSAHTDVSEHLVDCGAHIPVGHNRLCQLLGECVQEATAPPDGQISRTIGNERELLARESEWWAAVGHRGRLSSCCGVSATAMGQPWADSGYSWSVG